MSAARTKYARLLGKQGGLKGGPARAAKMTKEQRSDSARKAVNARWDYRRIAAEQAEQFHVLQERIRNLAYWFQHGVFGESVSASETAEHILKLVEQATICCDRCGNVKIDKDEKWKEPKDGDFDDLVLCPTCK